MSSIPPSLPFRIQAAYGNQPSVQAKTQPAPKQMPPAASKLVAGQVSGKVSFAPAKPQDTVELSSKAKAPTPAAPRDVLPMYRNPMEKNAVATAVMLGRTLDAKG